MIPSTVVRARVFLGSYSETFHLQEHANILQGTFVLSRLTESIKQHLDARTAQSIRPQSVFKTGMHQKSLLANVEFQVCKGAQFLSFSKWRRRGWDLTHNASRSLLPNKARSRCPARSVGPSGGRARTSPPLGAAAGTI